MGKLKDSKKSKQELPEDKDVSIEVEKEPTLKKATDSDSEKAENKKEAENKEEAREEDEVVEEEILEEEVLATEVQNDMSKKLLRLQADFLNYKNRAEKEKDRIYIMAVEDTICDFLPILDNLDRAIESTDETGSFKDGVHMIYTQLKQTLEKKGLKEIEALGETFDPYLHHGVSSDEVEGVEPNTIIEVFQKGYKLKDKVIRPSMVKVSR